ncbi:MAG: formylglycine-generating enzyme family protein [Gemmatimonadota bacterium]
MTTRCSSRSAAYSTPLLILLVSLAIGIAGCKSSEPEPPVSEKAEVPTPAVPEKVATDATLAPQPEPLPTPPEPAIPAPGSDAEALDATRITVHTSSEVPQTGPASAISDGISSTAWMEGAVGDGVGEWVELNLGRRCTVWRLEVWNGVQAPATEAEDPFLLNQRVQDVQVDLGDGNPFLYTLEDRKDRQVIPIDGKAAETIRLRIRSVYKATRPNTGLSEVTVFVSKEDLAAPEPTPAAPAVEVAAPAPEEPPAPVEVPPEAPPVPVGPEPVVGVDRSVMTMVDIPGGMYTMGAPADWAQEFMDLCLDGPVESSCAPSTFSDQVPAHEVRISTFYMDTFEVTNGNYQRCVQGGRCRPSKFSDKADLNGSNLPVVGVAWQDAVNFCGWAGRRLPTEAEWEYAARRGHWGRYPWGNQPPDGSLATYCDDECVAAEYSVAHRGSTPRRAPDPVNAHSNARTADGLYNMAGNVWEWTADAYNDATYRKLAGKRSVSDPVESGRSEKASRVVRGGGWSESPVMLDARFRRNKAPNRQEKSLGFRCASSGGGNGMTRIPGGTFMRGIDEMEVSNLLAECQQDSVLKKCSFDVRFKDQTPQCSVELSPFRIDLFPTTVRMYRECFQQGLCKEAGSLNQPGFNDDDQPITGVPWDGAKTYCEAQGKRLCTEAEWEAAARGKDPSGFFPWGSKDITPNHAVFCYGECAEIASRERGKDPRFRPEPVLSRKLNVSSFGVYDLSGNVCEWTADKYMANSYRKCAKKGCKDPTYRVKSKREDIVVRGGSFNQGPTKVTATYRGYRVRNLKNSALGFRCCQTPSD